jgi:hypothetical protein
MKLFSYAKKLACLLLFSLCFSSLAQALEFDPHYRYEFVATCAKNCKREGSEVKATLQLNASYHPGTQLTKADFFSFKIVTDSYAQSISAPFLNKDSDFLFSGVLPWGSDEASFYINWVSGFYKVGSNSYQIFNNLTTRLDGSFTSITDAECCRYPNKKYSEGISGVWTLVAGPVPEPETYAMLLSGLALLAVATRRAKQGKRK